jgi:L-ascorbate metabolism protein UlaG (beta-lactamase superfamily)
MHVRWYGQSAFRLTGAEHSVVIDPFGQMGAQAAAHGIRFDYPPIEPAAADLLLITHEHADHNEAAAVTGAPFVVRSTAGRFESPLGEVVAVASEHDGAAGTLRGPNAIFVFTLDGVRVAHFGDLGQASLRDEQLAAIGAIDLAFLPVGGGPTIGATEAAAIVSRLRPAVVVPMHYRTERVSFLEPVDGFLTLMACAATRLSESSFELSPDELAGEPRIVVPQAP